MRSTGRLLAGLCLLWLAVPLRADVTASVDRNQVAMGDTLRLVITATAGEEIDDAGVGPLQADFEILQRSTSSNTSFVNGQRSHEERLVMDITPRREGSLEIPPLRFGREATAAIPVSVGPAPTAATGGQSVIFEAAVDRESVYVQGQVLLTLRLQQAVNLEGRSIGELELEGAFVKPLEQRSFQRNRGGRTWLVTELRYAIFPEQSGTLEIPPQTFVARESLPRRSLFDFGGGGRQLRRTTSPLSIEVLPRPGSYPGDTWLPGRSLNVEESWSTPPEQLKVGESATRTIRIRGEGLQGAQLPPILFPPTEGIKYYPDQPVISDTEVSSGLLGSRQDSAAVVPTRAGTWEIPEIRIPWWDTETGELREAVVPGRRITVAAAEPAPGTAPTAMSAVTAPDTVAAAAAGENALPWKIASAVAGLGWLLTLVWLIRFRAGARETVGDEENQQASEKAAFRRLLKACDDNDGVRARGAVIDWSAALCSSPAVVSLNEAAGLFGDDALARELANLDDVLYGGGSQRWDGSALATCVRRLRAQRRRDRGGPEAELELYPRDLVTTS